MLTIKQDEKEDQVQRLGPGIGFSLSAFMAYWHHINYNQTTKNVFRVA